MFEALSLEMMHLWGFLIMAFQALQPSPKQPEAAELPVPKVEPAHDRGRGKGCNTSRGKRAGTTCCARLARRTCSWSDNVATSFSCCCTIWSRNNGSSSSSSSSSTSSVGWLDGKCHTQLLNMSCSGDFLSTVPPILVERNVLKCTMIVTKACPRNAVMSCWH